MATIELRQVEKRFGTAFAVKPMDLTITDGEFVVLLGPSGCGKTTTLRMISGLETVTTGDILLNGRNVTWLHPSERDIAFVFQFYALYPHLSARDNISFPLRAQGMKTADVDRRVAEVVELLRIGHLLTQRPGRLSGGDQQRIALARALVRHPAAFLMDEPLGALDAEFRESMRAEIKRVHNAEHATTAYVTHDQIEAMAMGDRIVVMSAAEVQQVGTPSEVYYDPSNLFVARFIGSPGMNLLKGHLVGDMVHVPGANNQVPVPSAYRKPLQETYGREGDVMIGFRPESALVSDDGPLAGAVFASDLHGAYRLLHVHLGSGEGAEPNIVHVRSDRMANLPIGATVRFDVLPEMLRFFDPGSQQAIPRDASVPEPDFLPPGIVMEAVQ